MLLRWEGRVQSRWETRPGVPQARGEFGMPARQLRGDGAGEKAKAALKPWATLLRPADLISVVPHFAGPLPTSPPPFPLVPQRCPLPVFPGGRCPHTDTSWAAGPGGGRAFSEQNGPASVLSPVNKF